MNLGLILREDVIIIFLNEYKYIWDVLCYKFMWSLVFSVDGCEIKWIIFENLLVVFCVL